MAARTRARATSVAGLPTDSVGRMLPVWKNELPDLDLGTEGIVERIQKINKYIGRLLDETLCEFNLDHGEWAVLMALRRTGKPYRTVAGRSGALHGSVCRGHDQSAQPPRGARPHPALARCH